MSDLPPDITSMGACVLSVAIEQKQVSCKEVMLAYLDRIHRVNPRYTALVSLQDDERSIALAVEADEALARGDYRGWLHGMPLAVKDLNDAKGFPTSRGSPIFEGQIAKQDSLMTRRIRDAGALFIGKTNVPEFGLGSQSYNPVFGATGNAYNPDLTAGGSSGGAASALGLQLLPVADGSDYMGSLRNPAGFNNVIGFRPTQGRVPNDGSPDLYYQQLGTGGPMGRNCEDTICLLDTLSGSDPGQPLSLREKLPLASSYGAAELKELKIGWMGSFDNYLQLAPGIVDLCEQSLKILVDQGAEVEPCIPNYSMERLWQTWLTLRHWSSIGLKPIYDDVTLRAQLKPEAIWEIEGAFQLNAQTIYRAGIARADWFNALAQLFHTYDILVLPSAQVFPFAKEIHWPVEINGRGMDTYHRWMEVVIGATLAGLPVVNLPVGFDADGRPMGMQAIGAFGCDKKVLEFGLAYEAVTSHLGVRPKLKQEE